MLNKHKVYQELQQAAPHLFLDAQQEKQYARQLWQQIADDKSLAEQIIKQSSCWSLPTWTGSLDDYPPIDQQQDTYRVISVDGSQIYPDRHQGVACFLLNIGSVDLFYGEQSSQVKLDSTPIIGIIDDEQKIADGSPDIINCRRTELEFRDGFALTKQAVETNPAVNTVFLFDGSLIFWHLENKEPEVKFRFLTSYIATLDLFYQHNIPLAGYISLPKSKDLVNIIRTSLSHNLVSLPDSSNLELTKVTDTDVLEHFLKPWTRSILFSSHSNIVKLYPAHSKPCFFYMHIGDEIIRIEIPAWISQDSKALDAVIQVIADQCIKGHGYPVALAEAHEQAVVKNADRELFYQMLYSISVSHNQKYAMSLKSLKKRFVAV